MFDLFEMMKRAQGGEAMFNLARHFGLTPDQTAKVVEAMMPAFVSAMQRQMTDPTAGMRMMQAVFSGQGPQNPYMDAVAAFAPEAQKVGETYLSMMFGDKDVAAEVTRHLSAITGHGQQMVAAMMPVIASMTFGGLHQSMTDSPFAAMMAPFMKKPEPAAPDWSAVFSPRAMEAGMADMMKFWGAMVPGFDAARSAGMKDVQNPAGPNTPMGAAMAEYFKALHAGEDPKGKAKAKAGPKAPETPADMFSQMLSAGKEAQAAGTQAFEDIYDRFWGRKPAKK